MPEKLEKLHIILCIIAALTVTVVCIIRQTSLYRMSIWVSTAIVVFYGLGQIVRLFLIHLLYKKTEEPIYNHEADKQPDESDNDHAAYADVLNDDDV